MKLERGTRQYFKETKLQLRPASTGTKVRAERQNMSSGIFALPQPDTEWGRTCQRNAPGPKDYVPRTRHSSDGLSSHAQAMGPDTGRVSTTCIKTRNARCRRENLDRPALIEKRFRQGRFRS